jgi:nitric oxide reductase subunit C
MASDRQHFMIITVLMTAFLSYSIYLYSALPVKPQPLNKEADSGKLTWQKYNCNACHQVYGLGGYLGPDLTNTYSVRGAAYIQAFLKTGTATMPDFKLSDKEINDLISFMKVIDASGKSDPKTFTLHHDGTIEQ